MGTDSKFESFVVKFTEGIIKWRYLVILLVVGATMMMAMNGKNLYFNTNYKAFFKGDNPHLVAFEDIQDIYSKNDNIFFVITPKDGKLFNQQTLKTIEDMSAEAWQLPYATRVDAITNYQHTDVDGDDLVVADLVEGAMDKSDEELQTAQKHALAEPLLVKNIINEESSVTGINVTVAFSTENMITETPEAVKAARELAAKYREIDPNIEIRITGLAMLNNAFSEASQGDMGKLIMPMFVLMLIIMFFMVRSVSGVIVSMFVIIFSIMFTMGSAGLVSLGLTPPSAQAPIIIMTLAIADSVHILVTLTGLMGRGMPKREAIVESLRINFMPVFFTSFTTAIGFLSLNFSEVPPFNHLGNMAAVGVMAAFVYSVTLLPAAMAILPVKKRVAKKSENPLVSAIAGFAIRKRKTLLAASILVPAFLISLIPLNIMDDRFLDYFDNSIEFKRDSDYLVDNLTGLYNVEFSLQGEGSGSVADPEYLKAVSDFTDWYRAQPGVVSVRSFTDIMKRLNQTMHGDSSVYYKVPEDRDLAAQYLLLYEMSLPLGLDLTNQVNIDKSSTRFTVVMDDLSASEMKQLGIDGEEWLVANAPSYMHTLGASATVTFANISQRNLQELIKGGAMALLFISFLLIFAFRSLRMGLISLIPNLVPIAMAFGVWAIYSGVINLSISIVIGMTTGIVVDDTIHFLSKYLRAKREKGLDSTEAIKYAFSTVGVALIATTTILVIGFGLLTLSAFDMNSSMAKLTAMTVVIALLADFYFLPAILLTFDKKSYKK